MTSFPERLINLRESHDWSKTYVAKHIGLKNMQTYANWEYGKSEPDQKALKDLANLFDVSTDYLLGNSDKRHYYDLTKKEKMDLSDLADKLLEGTTADAESDYMGEPSTPEQKANLRAAILTAMELNKMQAKKKFTPKKYRDSKGENGNN